MKTFHLPNAWATKSVPAQCRHRRILTIIIQRICHLEDEEPIIQSRSSQHTRTAHHACQRYSWPFRTGKQSDTPEPDFLPLQNEMCGAHTSTVMDRKAEGVKLYYTSSESGRRFPDHHRWTTPATGVYQLPLPTQRSTYRKGKSIYIVHWPSIPDRITFSVSDTGPGIPCR